MPFEIHWSWISTVCPLPHTSQKKNSFFALVLRLPQFTNFFFFLSENLDCHINLLTQVTKHERLRSSYKLFFLVLFGRFASLAPLHTVEQSIGLSLHGFWLIKKKNEK